MSQAKEGNTVKVHYTGKLESGEVFDTSQDREPLQFTLGGGNIIPGFDNGVRGMKTGDKKTITIPPEEAYGSRRDDLVANVDRADFPENITPEIGQQLQMEQPDGTTINVVIAEISDQEVTLDANHPLAGKTLIFEVELVEVA
ncbi:MAG: peptidylprolyl isomerase [candidate division Zixibacteria bacterium]|nr:peptidylprolyl isomerase [candidate division Zixibacteria bacterium]